MQASLPSWTQKNALHCVAPAQVAGSGATQDRVMIMELLGEGSVSASGGGMQAPASWTLSRVFWPRGMQAPASWTRSRDF